MYAPEELLKWYEALAQKVLEHRRHHYDAKSFISGAKAKEHRTGLEIDKMIREEIARRKSLEKETQHP